MVTNSPQTVPQIAGVNMATALARLAGNAKLLLKLFGDFRKQNLTMVQQVQETLDAGDTETAQRLLHTVKGVAANLAMDDLAEAAKVAEYTVRENNRAALPQALAAMQVKLDEVCSSIEQALAPAEPAPVAVPGAVMDEHTKKAFAETIRLAVRHSPDAAFVFETVRETVRALHPQQADAIAGHLDSYAFGEALKELQKLAEELKLIV